MSFYSTCVVWFSFSLQHLQSILHIPVYSHSIACERPTMAMQPRLGLVKNNSQTLTHEMTLRLWHTYHSWNSANIQKDSVSVWHSMKRPFSSTYSALCKSEWLSMIKSRTVEGERWQDAWWDGLYRLQALLMRAIQCYVKHIFNGWMEWRMSRTRTHVEERMSSPMWQLNEKGKQRKGNKCEMQNLTPHQFLSSYFKKIPQLHYSC